MPTIKTQLVSDKPRIITKIVNGQILVSCSCCGYCSYFDISVLLYNAGFSGSKGNGPDTIPVLLDFGNIILEMNPIDSNSYCDDSDRPSGDFWRRINACWRFLCREVNVLNGEIISESNKEIGGSTTTGKSLWEDICFPLFGDEEQSGTYIYSINFLGWGKSTIVNGLRINEFVPSDQCYDIIIWKITEQI